MIRESVIVFCVLALGAASSCPAHEGPRAPTSAATDHSLLHRETLTDGWLGLGRTLAARGVSVGLSVTQAYQMNLRGGLATHRHAGRYAGSYDLELTLDLEKLLGVKGAMLYALAEGSWSDGLDASSVGSVFGVNDDAAGDRAILVSQLFYHQLFLDGKLHVRVGKLDLTGTFEQRGCAAAFDGNAFANDETAQFLNGALVNNPTIPFPEEGLGAMVMLAPMSWFYVAAGIADARAQVAEMGTNTAFHGADSFFSIFETGLLPEIPSARGPLQGAYRVGVWHDPQPKDQHDGSGTKRDDVGFYLSLDQMVLRESPDAGDGQGLGLFARYGFAHDDVNEIEHFWSVGGQYQGLIPTRDDDVLGIGFARGRLVRDAGFGRGHESVLEVYYSAVVTPWLRIGPSLQYIWSPGGADGVGDAAVLGVRLQMAF